MHLCLKNFYRIPTEGHPCKGNFYFLKNKLIYHAASISFRKFLLSVFLLIGLGAQPGIFNTTNYSSTAQLYGVREFLPRSRLSDDFDLSIDQYTVNDYRSGINTRNQHTRFY